MNNLLPEIRKIVANQLPRKNQIAYSGVSRNTHRNLKGHLQKSKALNITQQHMAPPNRTAYNRRSRNLKRERLKSVLVNMKRFIVNSKNPSWNNYLKRTKGPYHKWLIDQDNTLMGNNNNNIQRVYKQFYVLKALWDILEARVNPKGPGAISANYFKNLLPNNQKKLFSNNSELNNETLLKMYKSLSRNISKNNYEYWGY